MTELDLLRQKIRTFMNEIADDLALGAAKDYPQYTHLTGMISALARIETEILDLKRRNDESEDEE